MLLLMRSVTGYAIKASDGEIGTVEDFLFDDSTWHARWMVVETGSLMSEKRLLLVHVALIGDIDHEQRVLAVRLTTAEVVASHHILFDEPVSRQGEDGIRLPSDWDPAWGDPRYVAGVWGGMGVCVSKQRLAEEKSTQKAVRGDGQGNHRDPHLRALTAIVSSHVHATDGDIGHVQDLYVDPTTWIIGYLVVDTVNFWPGKHVLVHASAVKEISWSRQEVDLDISRHVLRAGPSWHPGDVVDQACG